MASDVTTAARVVQDAVLLLRTIRDELREGRKPYATDVRRIIERGLVLRFAEYVQFLEKYGFLALDRRADLLKLTRAGADVAEGNEDRRRGIKGDAVFHFGDRLAEVLARGEADPVQGERFDKRFLRYEPLGSGGIGTVWRGRLLSVDRPVAIKVLDGLFEFFPADQHDELVRRLELAVRDHARLISPFVVQILDQNAACDPPYYVAELAEGGNLGSLLAGGPLLPTVAVRYFVQIALGLRAAHQQGLLHRDLKPENVLLDQHGNVKLSDLGITRVVERDGEKVRQAYVGFGSVGYMAPELFRPGSEVGPTVDIYALGILFYHMLVGELPGRRSPMPSQRVEGVPQEIDDLFDRMTQDDPTRRPASFDEVLTTLWTSKSLIALLDARQAPFFTEAPVELPGLSTTDAPRRAAPPIGLEEGVASIDAQPAPADEPVAVAALADLCVEDDPFPVAAIEPAPVSRPGDDELIAADDRGEDRDPTPAPAPPPSVRAEPDPAPRATPVRAPAVPATDLDDSLLDDPDPGIFADHHAVSDDMLDSVEDHDVLELEDVLGIEEEHTSERFSTAVVDQRGPRRRPERAEDVTPTRRAIDEKLKKLKKG